MEDNNRKEINIRLYKPNTRREAQVIQFWLFNYFVKHNMLDAPPKWFFFPQF